MIAIIVDIVGRPSLKIVPAVVALSLGLPVSADAQGEGASGLQPPDAVLDADPSAGTGFSMVTSVRELPDGRVLVADWQENRLAAVDMESGETMDLVRIGEGPGEFGRVGWVYELGDDLSLVTDAMSRRWSIFDGTEVIRTIPASEPLPIGFGPMLSGVDRSGSVLGTRVHPRPPVVRRRDADTLVLLLGHLDDSRIDTLATGLPAPPLTDGFGVSDLALVQPRAESGDLPLEEVLMASPAFPPGASVALYFEVYGLDPDESVDVAFEVQGRDTGFLDRVGRFLGLTSAPRPVELQWNESPRGEQAIKRVFFTLDVESLDEGDHGFRIIVQREDGQEAVAEREVTIG